MIVVDKKKYKMEIDENSKEVRVQVHGLMREEDAEGYMVDLQDTISKVSKKTILLSWMVLIKRPFHQRWYLS